MQSHRKTAKKSFRTEREFGLLVGFMLLALGGWWRYRGIWGMASNIFMGLGSILVTLGILFPRALVIPNRAWMAFAKILSLITTPIILAIIFFVMIMPIGVFKRLLGWDPLRRRAASAYSYWTPYNERQKDPRHFENMY